jgi:ABC-type lipoprotein export system ATPase subunit
MNVFKHPFTCIISGPSGCGKTSFCVRLIANLDKLCTESDFRDIVWCSSEDATIPREQSAGARRRIVYHRGIPNFEKASNSPRPVVLDDPLNEAYSRDVYDRFTKGSLHRNINVILITQNLFYQLRFSRDISLKAMSLVVLKPCVTRISLPTSPDRCIPKTATGCTRATSTLCEGRTVTCC